MSPDSSPRTPIAQKWLRGFLALPDGPIREGRALELLRQVAGGLGVARGLDQLCFEAELAKPAPRDALHTWIRVLSRSECAELRRQLREQAREHGLLALGRLLAGDGVEAKGPDADVLPIPEYHKGRSLSLGERKALARRPNRQAFDKLLRDPHQAVIGNLLRNPRLIEADVVALCARRPLPLNIAAHVAQDPRWVRRLRVRRALVLNPTTPPAVSVPLLALFARADLREVLESPRLPAVVRHSAREQLERRPPSDPNHRGTA